MTLSGLGLSADPFKVLILLGFAFALVLTAIFIALFILKAIGLMTMAEKLGIKNKWLGFVPIFDVMMIGKTASLYRGKSNKCFKSAPFLIFSVFVLWVVVLLIGAIMSVLGAVDLFFSADEAMAAGTELSKNALDGVLSGIKICYMAVAIGIIYKIIEICCLYRIYAHFDYKNAAIYTMFSLLFGFLVPFFISAASKKNPLSYSERNAENKSQFYIYENEDE